MSMSNIQMLERFIGYCSERSKVINENIANTATLNYKSKDLQFQDILDQEFNAPLKHTDSNHIQIENSSIDFQNKIVESNEVLADHIGQNNVQVDQEMIKLAETTIKFKFAAKKISSHYTNLQNVIKGGR